MNSRQKRSSGGYGLRRKIAKKRLDEDFEYYFSKVSTSLETKSAKTEDNRTQPEELLIADVKSNVKASMKNADSPEKRPRGRPRKIHVPSQEPDISDANLKFVALKEKRCKKSKVLFEDQNDPCKTVEEIAEKVDIISNVACEEEVEDECVDKRLKLEAVLSEEITGLREEEVSSIPEGEKENLPEEGVSLDSYSEERIIVPIGVEVQYETGEGEVELYEGEESGKSFALSQKSKRKYKRNRLSSETIRRLSQLSPDDKIECNECHKLLKPSSFRQHLRTHTGEKPFGCDVCEARFTRKGDVERHVRIVHNKQKPFKCCRCQRAFGDKKNLRWHLMNHDKKLFYVCEVCGFKFGKREYWENHVRYIHPLPGGMDPSEAGADDDVDEERLQALTDSLLEDESADEPCHDNDSCDGETNENFMSTSIGETVECRVINGESVAAMPFKCMPNVVKVSDSKENDLTDNSNVCVANSDSSGVEAVVIQINNSPESGENEKTAPVKETSKLYPANIIRVVAPRNVGHFKPDSTDHEQPIVIDTQEECNNEETQPSTPVVQILVPDEANNDVNTISANREPSKVISIVFNEEEDEKCRGNVRSLIEALLDAAHGQKKIAEVTEKT